MILYFSGTGNSAYAANYIGEIIEDQTLNLFEKIRDNDYTSLQSDRPWVIATPTYCWQIPRILEDWIMKTEFVGSKDIYFVMTCGSDVGNAEKYLQKLCAMKGFNYRGCAEIVMPENYIAMFNAPGKSEAKRVVKVAQRSLKKAAGYIATNSKMPAVKTNLAGKLNSSIVNKIYYPLIVKDKKFYAKDNCTGCGLCVRKCPLSNISMRDAKPKWHGDCTHCMACICYCPEEAIEYGKVSRGKERYTCPDMVDDLRRPE